MNLKHLTNKSLLFDTKALAQQYRHITTKLLHHLKEIERRKLFSDLGYPSLFEYVVKELGFSQSAAARRIQAARLLQAVPEIEKKIETGELNLTNLAMAAQTFKNENITDLKAKKDILTKIENTSTRECGKTLQKISEPEAPPKEIVIKVGLSEEAYFKLEEIKGLLAHRKKGLGEIFEIIFSIAIERLTEKKFKTKSSRETTSKNPRYITASLRKAVFQRDKVCQNCGGSYALEIDHCKPFALGGKTELENLRLLCRSCNQRARMRAAL